MTTTLTSTAQPPLTHPKTGLPIQRVATFAVGDLVTESIGSDAYPGVVVAVEGKGKTVYVRPVRFVLGNVSGSDVPGLNGYGDSATLVVDPESVEQAIAEGKGAQGANLWSDERGARKYVLRVSARPTGRETGDYPSHRQCEEVGSTTFHRARWAIPGQSYGSLSAGAHYRQDPHF